MTCDHGVRLDVFCGDCEDRWEPSARIIWQGAVPAPAGRRWGVVVVGLLLAVLAGTLLAWWLR